MFGANRSAFLEPIFNAAIEPIYSADRKQGILRYTSTNQFLPSYMEQCESLVTFAREGAALDEWVEIIGDLMVLKVS